jgi:multidrug efflux pump subunit AcrA (membrane-fusion protein)
MTRWSFLAVPVVLLFSCLSVPAQQSNTIQQGRSPDRAGAPVVVSRVTEQFHTISVGGRLEPKSRIVHRAHNAGVVRSLTVEEGDFVRAGQELFSTGRTDDVERVYEPYVVASRIAGLVSEVHIQVEDEIEESDPAVVIIGTEGYVLDAYISDKDAFKVDIGQQVSARTVGGSTITGTLVTRSQEPDYETGLFTLTFHFPNSQRTYVGEFVIIDLPVDRTTGLFVRRDLVIRRYGKYFLWIVDENQTLEAREVVLGPAFGDLVKIDGGLQAGEKYLSRITGREKEGQKIGSPGG